MAEGRTQRIPRALFPEYSVECSIIHPACSIARLSTLCANPNGGSVSRALSLLRQRSTAVRCGALLWQRLLSLGSNRSRRTSFSAIRPNAKTPAERALHCAALHCLRLTQRIPRLLVQLRRLRCVDGVRSWPLAFRLGSIVESRGG